MAQRVHGAEALLLSDHDPAIDNPTIYENFEQHPVLSLLAFASSTNLASMPAMQQLAIDPRMTRPERADTVRLARQELEAVTATVRASAPDAIASYTATRDPRKHLLTCAACGIQLAAEPGVFVRRTLEQLRMLRFGSPQASDTDRAYDVERSARIDRASAAW